MRKQLKRALGFGLALTAAGAATANDLYMDLSSDTFQIRTDFTHASNGVNFSVAALLTEDQGQVFSGGMATFGKVGNSTALSGGVGGKLYYGDTNNDNITALGLGGTLNFAIPGASGLNLVTDLYYAPSITVNDGFDNLSDLNLRLSWEAFENGAIYGGIRRFQAEYKNGDRHKFENGLMVGIKIEF
ncbi:YfaZ family outer membrane protein [Agaribacterium haliotis]|uniref:YfaZ family outer membrane protein n=1 Tax=Agaribacterium haliotis TaxID=2013869 RepID=UPI000BB59ECF|nr:YfaZ family outer membrane protein [Agaribacterium haliotis]